MSHVPQMLGQSPPVPEGIDDLAVALTEGGVPQRPVFRRPRGERFAPHRGDVLEIQVERDRRRDPGGRPDRAVLGIGSGLYFAVDMALATAVLPSSQNTGKDLGVINSADVLPQSIGPALAPLLLAIGSGHDYTALYLFSMVIGLTGPLNVTRIRTVN